MGHNRRISRPWLLPSILILLAVTPESAFAQTPPSITVTQPIGTQSGDVTIEYVITDLDNSTVDLAADYSLDGGSTWQPVSSRSGEFASIPPANYSSSFTWHSASDLGGQAFELIHFRVTPSDPEGTGSPDITTFPLDNKPPDSIYAGGWSGYNTLNFWFDEPVQDTSATNLSNISLSSGYTVNTIEVDKWTAPKAPYWPGSGSASAAIDGKFYLVGGDQRWNRLDVYDPDTDTWSRKIDIGTGRNGAVAATLDGKLYVTGGGGGMEIYNPGTDSWTGGAWEHYTQQSWGVFVAIEGKLYWTGGDWNDPETRIFNPITGIWLSGTRMPTERWASAFGVIDGKLYVSGGESGGSVYRSVLEVYDPSTDSWTTKASMPVNLAYAASGVIQGRFYVAGGFDGTNFSDKLYAYDPASDSWTTVDTIPNLRWKFTGSVIDNGLHIVGGFYGDYLNTHEVYNPQIGYKITLGGGQLLPTADSTLTITASSVTDWYGNTIASPLQTNFNPATGQAASVSVEWPIGSQKGSINIPYVVSDMEGNPVTLQVDYSTDKGNSWQNASVSGATSNIFPADYDNSFTWISTSDLPGEEVALLYLRITPSDNSSNTGQPVILIFDLDNSEPKWITAEGNSGVSTFRFWFNEPVTEASATDTLNISLSGGYGIDQIRMVEDWTLEITTSPVFRTTESAGVVALDGKLYVVGGWDNNTHLNRLDVYDPLTDSWSALAPLPSPRSYPVVATLNGLIYMLSGDNDGGRINALEVYDPLSGWSSRAAPPINPASWDAQAEAIGNRLYVHQYGDPAQIWIYNPDSDSWTYVEGGVNASSAATGVIDGKFYIAGGQNPWGNFSTELIVFDPANSSFTSLASMPTPRVRATGVVLEDLFYVIGGENNSGWLTTVEIYDPSSNTWTTGTSAPSGIREYMGAVIGADVYAGRGYWNGSEEVLAFDLYSRGEFEATLDSGQQLPPPPNTITVSASGISDWAGNVASFLDSAFTPSSGQPPTIALYQPTGTQSGDATVPFLIKDAEFNPVWLLAEYQLDGQSTWQPAAVQGDTAVVDSSGYDGSLIWNTGTDLANQKADRVLFRITPRDNATTWATPDSIVIHIDNQAPQTISANGVSGSTTLQFWFDEPVTESSATNTSNISLTSSAGSLTTSSIEVRERWRSSVISAPTFRYRPSVAVLDGKLYVVGGYDNFDSSNMIPTVEVYDPAGDSWSTASPMPTNRVHPLVAGIDGKLYVLGGWNSGSLSSLEVYDPESDSWSARNPAPFNGHYWDNIQGAVINGKWYVNESWNGIYVYDPHDDSWDFIADAGSRVESPAVGVIDGELYLAYGYSIYGYYTSGLVVFNPETGVTTTSLTAAPTGRNMAIGFVMDGRFYVVGGHTDVESTWIVEIYDPATDSWSAGSGALRRNYDFAGGVIDGRLYFGKSVTFPSDLLIFDTYDRDSFILTLGSGEVLPAPPDSVTITASNISDWVGNTTVASLDTTLSAETGQPPSVTIYEPSGTQSRDVSISYVISDPDYNPVWLKAEFQLFGESTWQTASLQTQPSNIDSSAYRGSLVWQSGSDLPDQVANRVSFKITPRDNETTWGTPDSTVTYIDNLAPATISIDAISGANSFSFWFDEPASETTAADVSNFTLTGGLTVNEIKVEEEWTAAEITIPTNRESAGVAVLDGKLYVVGGWGNSQCYSTVEVYDPVTDTWDQVSDMPTARNSTIVNAVNGKLYVAGGNTEHDWAWVLEVYDPTTDSWESRSLEQLGHSAHTNGRVINGKIYYNTEWDGVGIYVYDPMNDSWENLPSAGLRNASVSMAVIDDKLYIAGGWNDPGQYYDNSLVVYDPVTGITSGLASMPTSRANAFGAAIDGRFYVVGGEENSGWLSVTEIYDPATDNWTAGPMLPASSSYGAGGVIDGELYFCSNAYDPRVIEVLTRGSFELTLGDGESLPSPPNSITITASNISDWVGNVSSADISTDFVPSSGDPPTIMVYAPTGTRSHDVSINYLIEDNESNPVSMKAEYQKPGESIWYTAAVTGDTSGIGDDQYSSYITWNTTTDLPNQEGKRVRFRLTVRDNDTSWGGSDTVILNVDNGPPAWIKASSNVGNSTLQYWFNELVTESSATNTSNYTLSNGLTASSANAIEAWAQQQIIAPSNRFDVGVGTLDGKLYVVGGEDDGNNFQRTLEAYDPTTRIWETLNSMPTERSNPEVMGLNGLLYVLGGMNASGVVNILEVYDPESDTWSSAADPPFDNYPWDMAAEALNGRLYVNQCQYHGIYSYDPNTDSWELISGGLPHQEVASTVIDDKLYLAGGWNIDGSYLSHDLVVFDPVLKTTTWLAVTPLARQSTAGGTIDGKFLILGGNDDFNARNEVEYYDPASDSWATGSIGSPISNWNSFGTVIGSRFYFGNTRWTGSETETFFDTYLRDRFEMTLDGGQILPFDRISIQASGIADLFGNTSGTISGEFVPEDGNDNPAIILDPITDEVSGDISISFTITDTEGDAVDLTPEYSTDDGNSWTRATTSADTVNIDSANYSGSLTWYSLNDLAGQDITDVRFRIAPADNDLERGSDDTITLHVDNNQLPVITITGWTYSRTDTTCTINYQLSDAESDTLSLAIGYSTDMRSTWLNPTVSGMTSGITPAEYTGSIVWAVENDLPSAVMEVLLSMNAVDNDVGNDDEVTIYLNAHGVPSVTIDSTYTGELTGDITVPFTITDDESDYIGLLAEYLGESGSWQPATLSALSDTGRPSTEYTGSIVWTSYSDLGGIDLPNSGFRLTPYDANYGFADEVYFHIDNNDLPSIAVGTPSGTQHRDVDINYILSDPESDALGIVALYSTDGGVNWSEMNVSGSDTAAIGSGDYSGTITWHCFDDMGYGEWTSVMAKFLPYDLDPGTEDASAMFTIENYVGDYSADGSVSSADFATLIYAYNTQDTYHDIGPATGSVPLLMPVFDNVIDFEDLAVFIQMWNWSLGITAQQAEEGPRALVKPTTSERENQNHSVLLEEKIGDDPWAADDGVMDLELKARQVSGVMVTSVELTYDPEHLKFLALEPGNFMGRPAGAKQSLIYMQNVNEEKGRMSLLLGRIDREDPDVSGSGLLASLHFVKLSKENSRVTVAYEMWDRDAERLVQDSYTAEVHALRIPGEFALLQNYPNPFNGETVIRFQLPRAARVQMYVFNIRGQRVATLVDEEMDAGYHKISWDGRNDDNRKVASGIYIYLIQANRNRASQKLTIIK